MSFHPSRVATTRAGGADSLRTGDGVRCGGAGVHPVERLEEVRQATGTAATVQVRIAYVLVMRRLFPQPEMLNQSQGSSPRKARRGSPWDYALTRVLPGALFNCRDAHPEWTNAL